MRSKTLLTLFFAPLFIAGALVLGIVTCLVIGRNDLLWPMSMIALASSVFAFVVACSGYAIAIVSRAGFLGGMGAISIWLAEFLTTGSTAQDLETYVKVAEDRRNEKKGISTAP